MKYIIITILLALICCDAFAQKKQKEELATNIEFKQTTVNDEPALLITFDLNQAKDVPYYNVTIEAMVNGQKVKVDNVDGDIGTYIKKGTNKKVTWKIMRDVPNDDFKVEKIIVEAYPVGAVKDAGSTIREKPKVPLTASIGSIAGSGLGLLILGITQESKASADYEDYSNNRNPDSDFYFENDITRTELYDQANKKHKNAQIMMMGGGAVILAAGGILVSRIISNSRLSKRQSSINITPALVVTNYQNRKSNSFQIKLSRKF